MADNFAAHFLGRHGLDGLTRRKRKRVVIIDRKPYTAHPRSTPGKMPRVVQNLSSLEQSLKSAGGDVKILDFAQLRFKEQLKEVREADVLVGIHGAGLSHVMFMDEGSTLVELATNNLGMFSGFANWRPKVKYEEIRISKGGANYVLKPGDIEKVVKVMMNSN